MDQLRRGTYVDAELFKSLPAYDWDYSAVEFKAGAMKVERHSRPDTLLCEQLRDRIAAAMRQHIVSATVEMVWTDRVLLRVKVSATASQYEIEMPYSEEVADTAA